MGEGTKGETDAVRAIALARVGIVAWLGVMHAAEMHMQELYRMHVRRMWVARAVVLLNVATVAWDLADAQEWVRWVSVLPMWGAWYAFRSSERFAGDLPWMRTALADVREKIRTAKGMANENRS